jgi:hypothetical protein
MGLADTQVGGDRNSLWGEVLEQPHPVDTIQKGRTAPDTIGNHSEQEAALLQLSQCLDSISEEGA